MLSVDSKTIAEVVYNLLDNATKYSPQNLKIEAEDFFTSSPSANSAGKNLKFVILKSFPANFRRVVLKDVSKRFINEFGAEERGRIGVYGFGKFDHIHTDDALSLCQTANQS